MTKKLARVLIASALVALGAPMAGAADLADEVEYLRREVHHLRKEIAELKGLLKQTLSAPGARVPPAAERRTATVPVDGAPALGRADAPLTLIEFASYQCAICKQHHDTVFPKLKSEYIDRGKLRYVFLDLPQRHEPRAAAAANAAHCAGAQGKYWEMHRALFAQQSDLSPEALHSRAGAIGLDTAKFAACVAADTFAARVQRGPVDAQGAGFRATPSFVLGPTADGDRITGVRVVGAQSFAAFKMVIEHELEGLAGK